MRILLYMVLITAVLCVLYILLYNSDGNTLSPPFPASSYTKADSKNRGLFKFDLVPVSSLDIDSGVHLIIEDAWVENAWEKQARVFGDVKVLQQRGIQEVIAFEFQKDSSNHYYYFLGKEKLPHRVSYLCTRLDTFKIPIYRQTGPVLAPRRQRQAFDSINFVRK